MPPLTDVRDISRIAYGFMASRALFAALNLELFRHIEEGAGTVAVLADRTGASASGLATLLALLENVGLVTHDAGHYANAPAAARYLVPGAPAYFGDYYRFQIDRQIYPHMMHIEAGLQGDSGGLAHAIVDFPNVIEVARRYVDEAGMGERIDLVPGDALNVEWPGSQDVVLMSYLLSAVGEADIPVLLDRAMAALKPGGRLVIHDFMLNADKSGPFSAAGFFLVYLAWRIDPVSFSAEDLAPMVEAAGFVDLRHDAMLPEITKYLVARKPH